MTWKEDILKMMGEQNPAVRLEICLIIFKKMEKLEKIAKAAYFVATSRAVLEAPFINYSEAFKNLNDSLAELDT